ncbi:MAG TPA: ATP-binding protein [Phycisphaerales bacterium]|nr:ATP-binding protein [Phycisphaerales bacterium]
MTPPHAPTLETLRDLHETLSLAMKGGRMGWWTRDLATNTVVWSPELEQLFGLPPGGFPGSEQAFFDLVHPDDRKAVGDEVAAAIMQQRDYVIEFRFRHASDHPSVWRWMDGRGRAVYVNNRPTMLYGIGIDITDRRRAEDTIRANAAKLEQLLADADAHRTDLTRANRDLTDFAHIAAHDLKEPFRTINFQASFILDDHRAALPGDAIKKLEGIQKAAVRGGRLVDEMMRFARSGDVKLSDSPVELAALVYEAASTLPEYKEKKVELTIEPNLPSLSVDPVALSQVFQNLLANAARYNRSEVKRVRVYAREAGGEGGKVAEWQSGKVKENAPGAPAFPASHSATLPLGHSATPAFISICLSDNGVGIPPNQRSTAFRIFKRLHREEDFGPGSGVGLAIVKKIVEGHRGEVVIEDNPEGQGSVFVITLPRR